MIKQYSFETFPEHSLTIYSPHLAKTRSAYELVIVGYTANVYETKDGEKDIIRRKSGFETETAAKIWAKNQVRYFAKNYN